MANSFLSFLLFRNYNIKTPLFVDQFDFVLSIFYLHSHCFRPFHHLLIPSVFLLNYLCTLPAIGYCTSFTFSIKIDRFSGLSQVTDTLIGISNPPCSKGEAMGFFLKTSTSYLAPSKIEYHTYRESSLPMTNNYPAKFSPHCNSTSYCKFIVFIVYLSFKRHHLFFIRFPISTVLINMISS